MLKSNLIYTYLSMGILMFSNIMVMLIINNFSSVDVFGQLTLILATAGMLINFMTFRTGESVTRFLIDDDDNKSSAIVGMGLSFDVVVSLFLVAVFYILGEFFLESVFDSGEHKISVYYIASTLIFNLLSGSVVGRYTCDKNFKILAFFRVVEPVAKVLMLFSAALVESINLQTVCFVFFIAASIKFILMWGKYFLDGYGLSFLKIERDLLVSYISFTTKTFISTLLKSFNENADVILMGAFMNSYVVGVYQSLKIVTQPVRFLINPIASVRYPYYIELIKSGFIRKVTIEITKLSSLLFLLSVLYFIIVYLFIEDVSRVIGLQNGGSLNEILIYNFILVSSICICDWWFRLISLSTNPVYSIYSNAISVFLIWSVVLFGIANFELFGLCVGMALVVLAKAVYHFYILLSLNNIKMEEK